MPLPRPGRRFAPKITMMIARMIRSSGSPMRPMFRLLPDVFQRAGNRWRVASRGTAAILPLPPRLFIAVILMCLAIRTIPGLTAAQFASGVSVVEVYATVEDERGEAVSGLRAGDFLVKEDGRPQQISVSTEGDTPLSLAVARDRSFSLSRPRLAEAAAATQRMLGELRPADR